MSLGLSDVTKDPKITIFRISLSPLRHETIWFFNCCFSLIVIIIFPLSRLFGACRKKDFAILDFDMNAGYWILSIIFIHPNPMNFNVNLFHTDYSRPDGFPIQSRLNLSPIFPTMVKHLRPPWTDGENAPHHGLWIRYLSAL